MLVDACSTDATATLWPVAALALVLIVPGAVRATAWARTASTAEGSGSVAEPKRSPDHLRSRQLPGHPPNHFPDGRFPHHARQSGRATAISTIESEVDRRFRFEPTCTNRNLHTLLRIGRRLYKWSARTLQRRSRFLFIVKLSRRPEMRTRGLLGDFIRWRRRRTAGGSLRRRATGPNAA